MLEGKRIIICLIIIIIVGIIIGYFVYTNNEQNVENMIAEEYIPEQEISDEQLRNTMVSLYFRDDIGIIPEIRLIDVKKLVNNPYEEILNLLIQGPKNDKLQKTIAEGTKINKIEKNADILNIDFSKEFIENHKGGEEEEKITIKSIVNTLTELNEINGIKITIDGEENMAFNDNIVKFNKIFYKDN